VRVYLDYFGLTEKPFSIAPDPAYLYMSARHKEAMAHLSYGLAQGGCFIVLTGEVGTGKTTLCRNLLKDLPENMDVALILNANVGEDELLQTICDELKINYSQSFSQKQLLDAINRHLLSMFAKNHRTVLIIDEAQLLSPKVLEQIRLLTNLETTKDKLLQIILIGQPELNEVLSRNDLRQLAQRVTARYHLSEIKAAEIEDYVNYRLGVAGCKQPLFSRQALKQLHQLSNGIPRKINVLADHSLLAAYANNQTSVDSNSVRAAARDVFIKIKKKQSEQAVPKLPWFALAASLVLINGVLWWWFLSSPSDEAAESVKQIAQTPAAQVEPVVTESQAILPPPATSEAPEQVSAESPLVVAEDQPIDSVPVIDETAAVNQNELTTIVRSAEIEPGSVTIANEFLDDLPPAPATVSLSQSSVPLYDISSEFGKVLESSADITGRSLAFRNLAQAWDVPLPLPLIRPACDVLLESGIACLGVNSWQQLERYNRPSILVLQQGDQLHRAIVFSLGDDDAQVLIGENVHLVSQSELRARWNGNGITFWRPGEIGFELLQRTDIRDSMPSIRKRLNLTLSAANMPQLDNESRTLFDLEMAQKVFALQSLFGISPDSMIGPETYLLMNELLQADQTPVLRARVRRG